MEDGVTSPKIWMIKTLERKFGIGQFLQTPRTSNVLVCKPRVNDIGKICEVGKE